MASPIEPGGAAVRPSTTGASELPRLVIRGIALWIACDIQGPNNLRIERYLAGELALGQEALVAWRRQWIQNGFDAIERILAEDPATGRFCHGDAPTVADCFLIPQAYNAQRPTVGLDLATWPTIHRIWCAFSELPAFERALPQNQPDWQELEEH